MDPHVNTWNLTENLSHVDFLHDSVAFEVYCIPIRTSHLEGQAKVPLRGYKVHVHSLYPEFGPSNLRRHTYIRYDSTERVSMNPRVPACIRMYACAFAWMHVGTCAWTCVYPSVPVCILLHHRVQQCTSATFYCDIASARTWHLAYDDTILGGNSSSHPSSISVRGAGDHRYAFSAVGAVESTRCSCMISATATAASRLLAYK
jgi:hypothetical protein